MSRMNGMDGWMNCQNARQITKKSIQRIDDRIVQHISYSAKKIIQRIDDRIVQHMSYSANRNRFLLLECKTKEFMLDADHDWRGREVWRKKQIVT